MEASAAPAAATERLTVRLTRTFVVMVYFVVLLTAAAYAQRPAAAVVAVGNGTVYTSPTAAPIRNGVVLIRDGRIADVGPGSRVRIPSDADVIDAAGGVILAGFQNSHVHFTESKWARAREQPAAQLALQLDEMLTRFGFTTVVDTGSAIEDTAALRNRIDRGEIAGPHILTAGPAMYPAGGIPYYLRTSGLSAEMLDRLPQLASPAAAVAAVAANIAAGADIVKLFTGSWVTNQRVRTMSRDVAAAAARRAHAGRRLVFAHASNVAGLQVALDAGVDVLAHALDDTDGLMPEHLQHMKDSNMAMVPTLMLFGTSDPTILAEVRDFFRRGGQLLFGTDSGFHQQYSPEREYALLAMAGLDWRAVLATLTTAPAVRFGESGRRGRIAAGMEADLVVLKGDPSADVRALADVRLVLRAGRVIYRSR